MYIICVHVFVAGAHSGTPQRIGMIPDHTLGARRGTRSELHTEVQQRVGRAQVQRRGFEKAVERIRCVGGGPRLGRCAIVGLGHNEETGLGACLYETRESRLCYSANDLGVLGVVGQLVGHGSGIRRDCRCASNRTGKPAEDALRAVIEMDEHPVTDLHAPGHQASGDSTGGIDELRIRPDPPVTFEGLPHQKWVAAADIGLPLEQVRDVHIGERMEIAGSQLMTHAPKIVWVGDPIAICHRPKFGCVGSQPGSGARSPVASCCSRRRFRVASQPHPGAH